MQHHNGLHTFAPLFGFPTTLGSGVSAPSQKELTIWTRFFSRSLCLASDIIYSFFFFLLTTKKNSVCWETPLGNGRRYQLFFSISSITFRVETRDRLRGVENSAKKSSGRKPFYSIAPRGRVFHVTLFWRNSRIRSMIVFFHRPRP